MRAIAPAAAATGDRLPERRSDRRSVDLNGYALFEDGSTAHIEVLDLSYDGCRIRAGTELRSGQRIKISVPDRGAIDAEVRWARADMAGLVFLPGEAESRPHSPRISERVAVTADISLRRPGLTNFHVRIFDASPAGCKIECVERPKVNDRVWVKFDGLEALEARVCWVDGFSAGVSFLRPMHPAVFDVLLARLRG